MDTAPLYDLTEQLERIAGALEKITSDQTPEASFYNSTPFPPNREDDQHLSLFLESLPTWRYNCLRRKLLSSAVAAKILGISNAHLLLLTKHKVIKSKDGLYDVLTLLMWLDDQSKSQVRKLN